LDRLQQAEFKLRSLSDSDVSKVDYRIERAKILDSEALILGDHLKTGHTLSLQNRPTGLAEDVIVLPCGCVRLQGAG
jgi:hypothetical protein